MATDGFTITLGIIATGLFMFGKDVFISRHGDEKNPVELRLLAELLLLMYALMNHDMIVSAGQAGTLVITILMLFQNGMWSKISSRVKIITLVTPLLMALALITASTYQYRLLIPVLPTHLIIIGVSAYALSIGKCIISLTQRDETAMNTHRQILLLAGPLMLIAYSVLEGDLIIFIISTINCLRILYQLARSQSRLTARVFK